MGLIKHGLALIIEKVLKSHGYNVTRIGSKVFTIQTGNIDLSATLQGTYTYDEVMEFNDEIGYSSRLGHSNGTPIAIIGIPNDDYEVGSFKDVWEYGKASPEKEYPFTLYDEETAKQIGNYTVGFNSYFERIKKDLKFDKLNQVYEQTKSNKIRHLAIETPFVLDAEYKMNGTYSFKEIKKMLAQDKFRMTSFASYALKDGKPIAIIGVGYRKDGSICGFRDVWEYGKDEPEVSTYEPISIEDAQHITNFEVYGCDCTTADIDIVDMDVEKYDRRFDKSFDYYSEGVDYRMSYKNPKKDKVKTLDTP